MKSNDILKLGKETVEVPTNPIRYARMKYHMTQQQLSDLTGIPFRTIQNWETGQRKCPEYVEKLLLFYLDKMFEPVREGRWKGAGLGDYYCSLCCSQYSGGDEFNYCPDCGAKMK